MGFATTILPKIYSQDSTYKTLVLLIHIIVLLICNCHLHHTVHITCQHLHHTMDHLQPYPDAVDHVVLLALHPITERKRRDLSRTCKIYTIFVRHRYRRQQVISIELTFHRQHALSNNLLLAFSFLQRTFNNSIYLLINKKRIVDHHHLWSKHRIYTLSHNTRCP